MITSSVMWRIEVELSDQALILFYLRWFSLFLLGMATQTRGRQSDHGSVTSGVQRG